MKRFFKKAGRPTTNERDLCNRISAIIAAAENDNNADLLDAVDKIGMVNNEAGLQRLFDEIKPLSSTNNRFVNRAEEQTTTSNHNTEDMTQKSDEFADIQEESVQFEPMVNIAEESQFSQTVVDKNAEAQNMNQSSNNGAHQEKQGSSSDTIHDSEELHDREEPKHIHNDGDDSTSGNTGDLSPESKRKAVKKTAEIVSKIYSGALPVLPKFIAKIPESKVQKMARANEIDPNMELDMGNGTFDTVAGYIQKYNDQVDNTITITEEQQQEFKEALADVLNEKQVALTPQQRLLATVISHGFTMFGSAIELSIRMRQQMDQFKQFHEDNKKSGKVRARPQNQGENGAASQNNNSASKEEHHVVKKEETLTDSEEEAMITINPDEVKV